jgi:hypothetical protein
MKYSVVLFRFVMLTGVFGGTHSTALADGGGVHGRVMKTTVLEKEDFSQTLSAHSFVPGTHVPGAGLSNSGEPLLIPVYDWPELDRHLRIEKPSYFHTRLSGTPFLTRPQIDKINGQLALGAEARISVLVKRQVTYWFGYRTDMSEVFRDCTVNTIQESQVDLESASFKATWWADDFTYSADYEECKILAESGS